MTEAEEKEVAFWHEAMRRESTKFLEKSAKSPEVKELVDTLLAMGVIKRMEK